MDAYRHAKSIVLKLVSEGYTAYFAGGWVRDFLMGHPSEDIDIATDAPSEVVMALFPSTILVGLAFGIVIVVIEGHQFEVATFRKDLHYVDGRHPEGIEHSTAREDALRRDFTINGMFYDPLEEELHDFVQGRNDIQLRVIRTIGDPHARFFEDRLRMLRAFRFAARFSFTIDPETQAAIVAHADKLFPAVALERVWQEFNKMAAYPRFDQAIVEMHRSGLLDVIFPEIEGMHIKELRHIVSTYAHFPKETPTILYLNALFPKLSLSAKLDIAKRIKASLKDFKLIELFEHLNVLIQEDAAGESNLPRWAYFFSSPQSQLILEVFATTFPEEERIPFLQKYQIRAKQLEFYSQLIRENKSLITAAILQKEGILPGKQMGILIKEGEKIAIHKNLKDPVEVLQELRQLPIWNNHANTPH